MRRLSFISAIILIHILGYSQNIFSPTDTLKLTLQEAEKRFIEKNFLLISQKYGIEAAKGQIIQAKLWDNPTISLEQNTYNNETHRYFDVTESGETAVDFDQLFVLAGKRNKKVKLEKINTEIAEYQFYDLLRTLKYELRTNFYDLYFLQQSMIVYDNEIQKLKKIVEIYNAQQKKGNVSLKETTRLKAELFSLENERFQMLDSIRAKQGTIKLLIGDTLRNCFYPILDNSIQNKISINDLNLSNLEKMTFENRYDLKIYESQVKYQEMNYSLQKATAVPDMHLTGRWDRAGSYIKNYQAVGLSFDLPLWNLNRGNIVTAKNQLEQSKALTTNYKYQVKTELMQSLSRLSEIEKMYNSFDKQISGDFTQLMDAIILNYEKRNISLLEFIDYFETYKSSIIQMNALMNNRVDTFEELNFVIGKDYLKY